MSKLDWLLGILGTGSTIANVSLFKRFIAAATIVIALTAISSTMAGVLIIMAFYGLYVSLLHYGLGQEAAILAVSGLAVAVTAAFAIFAVLRWRDLKNMQAFSRPSVIVGEAGKVADAFLDGFLGPRR